MSRSSKLSATIADIKAFNENAMGWVRITVKDYRDFLEPLRRREWSEYDKERIQEYIKEGGAKALYEFYKNHSTASTQLKELLEKNNEFCEREDGSVFITEAPMSREDTEESMQILIAKCEREKWSAE